MKKCPQCGYERTPKDDDFISAAECPRCGVFYEKVAQQTKMADAEPDEAAKQESSLGKESPETSGQQKETGEKVALAPAPAPGPDMRRERILIQTDRYQIEGDITLPPEGYRKTLSDYINHNNQEFLCLNNVDLVALDGSERNWSSPVVYLQTQYIRLVITANMPAAQ